MPRGQTSKVGSTMINKNGYHNTKTEDGWRLTHHVLAEEKLGRPLKPTESVRFKDGNRKNLDLDNLVIVIRGSGSLKAQLVKIEERIRELTAQRDDIIKRLELRKSLGAS